jgi:hypothetical protein
MTFERHQKWTAEERTASPAEIKRQAARCGCRRASIEEGRTPARFKRGVLKGLSQSRPAIIRNPKLFF